MSFGSVPDSKFPSDLPSSILHIFVPYQLPTKKGAGDSCIPYASCSFLQDVGVVLFWFKSLLH